MRRGTARRSRRDLAGVDEIHLDSEATVLASRIRTIDRDLDALDQSARESVIRGLHNSGGAMMANLVQTASDKKRARLLAERNDLVQQLKTSVSADPDNADIPDFSRSCF